MILTVTVNPSIDKTVGLAEPLAPGHVQRAVSVTAQPGGKGINVATAVCSAGTPAEALFPAQAGDALLTLLAPTGLPTTTSPSPGAVRTNTAIVSPDGQTTKINEPGPDLSADDLDRLTDLIVTRAEAADWLVLAGSLPPSAPADLYPRIIRTVRTLLGAEAPLIALDTSGAPLTAALGPDVDNADLPDLIKPNGDELAELAAGPGVVVTGEEIEEDPEVAARLAQSFTARGVDTVLATLGGQGAVLVTRGGAWHAIHAPIAVKSTVGAGDSSLAGFLLASIEGLPEPARLTRAVAYGSAAAGLPGTTIPTPSDVTESAVSVRPLNSAHTSTTASAAL